MIGYQELISRIGHKALDCKENRALDLSKVADMSPEKSWLGLKVADASRDLDDFREVRRCRQTALIKV